MASEPIPRLAFQQYLAIEREASFRSEFIDGLMVAMAGGTMDRAILQRNVLTALHGTLRGTGGQVFGPDFPIQFTKRYCMYPDVAVACGKVALANDQHDCFTRPAVIADVLSPTSKKDDRGEHFTRQPDDPGARRDHPDLDAEWRIASIGVAIPLPLMYQRVELPAA